MGKHREIKLSDTERETLGRMLHSGHLSVRTNARARILLLSDRSQSQKRTDREVATAAAGTVRNFRCRFVEGGLEQALYNRPRPGQAPKVTGEVEAKLVMLACSAPPAGWTRWTPRLPADKMVELGYIDSISHVSVWEKLKKTPCNVGR